MRRDSDSDFSRTESTSRYDVERSPSRRRRGRGRSRSRSRSRYRYRSLSPSLSPSLNPNPNSSPKTNSLQTRDEDEIRDRRQDDKLVRLQRDFNLLKRERKRAKEQDLYEIRDIRQDTELLKQQREIEQLELELELRRQRQLEHFDVQEKYQDIDVIRRSGAIEQLEKEPEGQRAPRAPYVMRPFKLLSQFMFPAGGGQEGEEAGKTKDERKEKVKCLHREEDLMKVEIEKKETTENERLWKEIQIENARSLREEERRKEKERLRREFEEREARRPQKQEEREREKKAIIEEWKMTEEKRKMREIEERERLDKEFRARLEAETGSSIDEIKALLEDKKKKYQDKDKDKEKDEKRPTWIKVHSKYLLPETLIAYRLPWDWDPEDANYLMIKQWITEDFQEELFAHTRRLQQNKSEKVQSHYGPEAEADKEPALYIDLEDQYFIGPSNAKGLYASIGVLDSVVTIERHDDEFHIAARFNIETTILQYNFRASDHHELFFHDICLQYLNNSATEVLIMEPESDPAAAFTVTRSTDTTVSGNVGLSFSGTPSGNVALGLSRSTGLTVQYALDSWSVSAHHVVQSQPDSSRNKGLEDDKNIRYQWFWAGTQEETKRLTTDLKHTVKRHVVVKRIIPAKGFPFNNKNDGNKEDKAPRNKENEPSQPRTSFTRVKAEAPQRVPINPSDKLDNNHLQPSERLMRALEQHFKFTFCIQVRIKRRYGRLHRLFLLSLNEVKAGFLKPVYKENFQFQPDLKWLNILLEKGTPQSRDNGGGSGGDGGGSDGVGDRGGIPDYDDSILPQDETVDIDAMLDKIKEENGGNWDKLQGKRVVDILGRKSLRTVNDFRPKRKRNSIASLTELKVNDKKKDELYFVREKDEGRRRWIFT